MLHANIGSFGAMSMTPIFNFQKIKQQQLLIQ